jgi:hypothetical protein
MDAVIIPIAVKNNEYVQTCSKIFPEDYKYTNLFVFIIQRLLGGLCPEAVTLYLFYKSIPA